MLYGKGNPSLHSIDHCHKATSGHHETDLSPGGRRQAELHAHSPVSHVVPPAKAKSTHGGRGRRAPQAPIEPLCLAPVVGPQPGHELITLLLGDEPRSARSETTPLLVESLTSSEDVRAAVTGVLEHMLEGVGPSGKTTAPVETQSLTVDGMTTAFCRGIWPEMWLSRPLSKPLETQPASAVCERHALAFSPTASASHGFVQGRPNAQLGYP